MARYAIDAATLLRVVDDDLPVAAEHRLVAPNVIRSEALQLLLDAVRRGERTEDAAMRTHEQLTAVKLRLLGDRVSRRVAWQLARANDWASLRDAEHLAVAKLQADALVTVDERLAARAAGVVAVLPVAALAAAD